MSTPAGSRVQLHAALKLCIGGLQVQEGKATAARATKCIIAYDIDAVNSSKWCEARPDVLLAHIGRQATHVQAHHSVVRIPSVG